MTLPPKVIVSPIDFSRHSDDALGTAADLASRFGSELCLIHVVPAIPKLPSARTLFKEAEYEQALHADTEKQLGQMAEELARRGIAAKFVVGTANDTSMEIIRLAEENRADPRSSRTQGGSAQGGSLPLSDPMEDVRGPAVVAALHRDFLWDAEHLATSRY